MIRDHKEFDQQHAQALSRIWILGDVHGHLEHISMAWVCATVKPKWLIFVGDIVENKEQPLREALAPINALAPELQVFFIHGNHDADSAKHWAMLHDCGNAVALHGHVIKLDGVRVAGLGGNFMGRVWYPPAEPLFTSKADALRRPVKRHVASPSLQGAIYPDEYDKLSKLRADLLVTHEAPSCHRNGFEALDELARSMRVVRSFHGHHHDDLSDEYALVRNQLGFDARGVNFRGIKDGHGRVLFEYAKQSRG